MDLNPQNWQEEIFSLPTDLLFLLFLLVGLLVGLKFIICSSSQRDPLTSIVFQAFSFTPVFCPSQLDSSYSYSLAFALSFTTTIFLSFATFILSKAFCKAGFHFLLRFFILF
jgi:di/tricarboxylate transporter